MSVGANKLKSGTRLRFKNGEIVTLDRRKRRDDDHRGLPFHPGWWLRDGAGGLSDSVINDPTAGWTALDD